MLVAKHRHFTDYRTRARGLKVVGVIACSRQLLGDVILRAGVL